MAIDEPVSRFETAGGARIYRIPMQVFPSLRAYAHLVVAGGYVALVDVGSGQGESDANLIDGLGQVREKWGDPVGWSDIDRIVISHAHIDHHGGLNMVREHSAAPIAVHELDRRVLVHYEERRLLSRAQLGLYLERAGVTPEQRAAYLELYGRSKGLFRPVGVEDVLRDGDRLDGLFEVIHVPGHCPGQICLRIDDLLLTADHVLPDVAIFLSPESLAASNGLRHFLQSLRRVAGLSGVRLALGGHGAPVRDLPAAVAAIEATQHQRLARVRQACAAPRSLAEITAALYPRIGGYDALLAIQKVGAYVEYLDQRGELGVANLDEIAADDRATPRYYAI